MHPARPAAYRPAAGVYARQFPDCAECRIAGVHRAVARMSTRVLTVALKGTTLRCRPKGVAYIGITEADDVRARAARFVPAKEEV